MIIIKRNEIKLYYMDIELSFKIMSFLIQIVYS